MFPFDDVITVKRLVRQTQWAYNQEKKFDKDRGSAKFPRKTKHFQKAQTETH